MVLLKKAFENYNLFLPCEIFCLIHEFESDLCHTKCKYCDKDLIKLCVIKPFIKQVPVYYQVFNEHVFTKEGMLTCAKNSSVTETTSDMQGNITFAMTPDILKMSNICVKNEVVTYKQVNWFKCIYSHLEENFVYLCAHCFLRKKRKLRIFFNTFKRLIAQ